MNYRIKEQYGFFYIEKEITLSVDIESFKSIYFPFLFKPKKTTRKEWVEIGNRGFRSGLTNPQLKFDSKKSAKKAIINLLPKYHRVV